MKTWSLWGCWDCAFRWWVRTRLWYLSEESSKNGSLSLSTGDASPLLCIQKPMSFFQQASLHFLFFFQFILIRNYLSFLCKKTSRLVSPENRGVSLVIADSVYSLQAFNCLFVLETCSKLIMSSQKCDTDCSCFDPVRPSQFLK